MTPAATMMATTSDNQRSRRRRSRSFASLKRSFIASNRCLCEWLSVTSSGVAVSVTVGIKATIIVFISSFKSSPEKSVNAELGLERLDRSDPTLLHEQVAGAIRRAIAEGEAAPGERIPQAKDLAAELGVNTNTVLRALRVLRDEGVIEMGRGRSIRVTGQPERAAVSLKLKELVDVARAHGYRRDDLIFMLQEFPGP
jgi:GntR family transcriptional regulator